MLSSFRAFLLFRGRPAAVMLVAAGMLVGSLLTSPGIGLAAVTPAAVQTRVVSCDMFAFHPTMSGTNYGRTPAQVLARTGPGGSSTFHCALGLPNSAVVTKFQITAADGASDGEMGACSLRRESLDPATSSGSSSQTMASVPGTGTAAVPGKVRLTDDTIVFPTVKNGKFGYGVFCELGGKFNAGLIGAAITYSIDSANG